LSNQTVRKRKKRKLGITSGIGVLKTEAVTIGNGRHNLTQKNRPSTEKSHNGQQLGVGKLTSAEAGEEHPGGPERKFCLNDSRTSNRKTTSTARGGTSIL